MVYSINQNIPIFKKTHQSAIRALNWNPKKRNILASGGGSYDKTIRIFDISKKK